MDKAGLHPPVCKGFNKPCHLPPSTVASYFCQAAPWPTSRKRPAEKRTRRASAPFATPQAL